MQNILEGSYLLALFNAKVSSSVTSFPASCLNLDSIQLDTTRVTLVLQVQVA